MKLPVNSTEAFLRSVMRFIKELQSQELSVLAIPYGDVPGIQIDPWKNIYQGCEKACVMIELIGGTLSTGSDSVPPLIVRVDGVEKKLTGKGASVAVEGSQIDVHIETKDPKIGLVIRVYPCWLWKLLHS